MANVLRHGEFWLPPEFLTDDDLHMDKVNLNGNDPCFPSEFPYEFGESESDEEDISGLTRQFSLSTLRNPQKISFHPSNLEAKWGYSGSPQSTLSPAGSWSVSSNGSPNGPSQVPSPPTTPFVQLDDTWDLIYAAAGQVARMKMNRNHIEEPPENRASFPPTRSFAPPNYSNNCSSHSLCHHKFQQVRSAPVIKQQGCSIWGKQERERWFPPPPEIHQIKGLRVGVENGRSMGLPPSAWPPLEVQNHLNQNQLVQQNNGSAMRAVFLSGSVSGVAGGGVKRECAGTGVFIPRNPSECRKRPACSTALPPARAIQGLNKNFEPLISRAQAHVQSQAHFNGGFITNHEVLIARRNAAMAQQQQQQQQRQNIRPEVMMKHHEVLLPQEWTY